MERVWEREVFEVEEVGVNGMGGFVEEEQDGDEEARRDLIEPREIENPLVLWRWRRGFDCFSRYDLAISTTIRFHGLI